MSTSTTPVTGTGPLPRETVEAFRAKLRGPLILPGEPGYEDSRSVWNAMIDRRPVLVVRALNTPDVIATVNFAREQNLTLSIKGGGHNIAGLAVADGGLLLDMGLMRGVWVDPAARIAHAQAGCLLGDVDRETQVHGLAAVLGFISNTGIAGLTLGGGFGYVSRRFGYTCDNVLSITAVTAEGKVVRASERENADLFWGLCGGGGNFGVATDFEFKLYPLGPEIVGGAIAWPAEQAAEVEDFFVSTAKNAPPELALVLGFRPAPPAPWIAKEAHGKPIVAVFACHTGPVAEGEKLLAPLKALGKPVGDILMKRTYVSQQSLIDGTQPKGRRYYWKSEYLPGLDPKLLEKLRSHAGAIRSPHSAILLFPIGDAIARLPNDHSAVGNRDTRWLFNVAASWEKREEDATHRDWARQAWEDLRPFSTGGTYVNFLNEEEVGARIEAAYGANLRRLAQIKSRWDPGNLFRANKNIAPSS